MIFMENIKEQMSVNNNVNRDHSQSNFRQTCAPIKAKEKVASEIECA